MLEAEEHDAPRAANQLRLLCRRHGRVLFDSMGHITHPLGLLDGVEHTQKEAADALGISQSYISRLEKRIIRQLKEVLERE